MPTVPAPAIVGQVPPMKCPWCAIEAAPRHMHAHFTQQHGDVVRTEERRGNQFYSVACPRCDAAYEQRVKKGSRDPGFLAEFDREIRMVALDMLVHHLVAEHESPETGA